MLKYTHKNLCFFNQHILTQFPRNRRQKSNTHWYELPMRQWRLWWWRGAMIQFYIRSKVSFTPREKSSTQARGEKIYRLYKRSSLFSRRHHLGISSLSDPTQMSYREHARSRSLVYAHLMRVLWVVLLEWVSVDTDDEWLARSLPLSPSPLPSPLCLKLVQLVQNLLLQPGQLLVRQRRIVVLVVLLVIVVVVDPDLATLLLFSASRQPTGGEQLAAATRSAGGPVSPLVQQAVVQLGL